MIENGMKIEKLRHKIEDSSGNDSIGENSDLAMILI